MIWPALKMCPGTGNAGSVQYDALTINGLLIGMIELKHHNLPAWAYGTVVEYSRYQSD
jgi:hypothetical protein